MRYWISQYEREAMENMHDRKVEISGEIESLLKKWSKGHEKSELSELKKLMTQARKNTPAFTQVMRTFEDTGSRLMDIYLKSWMILGPKPSKARSIFTVIMRNSL